MFAWWWWYLRLRALHTQLRKHHIAHLEQKSNDHYLRNCIWNRDLVRSMETPCKLPLHGLSASLHKPPSIRFKIYPVCEIKIANEKKSPNKVKVWSDVTMATIYTWYDYKSHSFLWSRQPYRKVARVISVCTWPAHKAIACFSLWWVRLEKQYTVLYAFIWLWRIYWDSPSQTDRRATSTTGCGQFMHVDVCV